jgi:DNA-binding response OmpR family regulator
VIVVTARALLEDRVAGLELGADDYLVKPFELAELMARAHAIARRVEGTITNKMIVGRLTIDRALRRAVIDNEEMRFSDTEFDILIVLACDYGKVVPREKLEEIIKVNDSENMQNLLDVYVLKLRKKLGKDAIINRRNDGFFLNV